MKAKEALKAVKKLSLDQGCDLRYNQDVKKVDIQAGKVELVSGEILRGKHVVISCGPFSDQFYKEKDFVMEKLPQETYMTDNNTGMPPTMVMIGLPEL